jgi:cobalt-zinc-cadmium efflux system membrane fusion protein
MRALTSALAAIVILGTACGSESPPTTARDPSAREAPPAAADGAMCAEHGVLLALCTKHNPKLIPVFQAKGDWCAEHGFPESICPICHPERGGKPAAEIASDDAPADGTKIRFKTRDTARLAGLETAVAAPTTGTSGLAVTARLVHDATRVAVVNARAPGVVRAVKADVGTTVRKGAPLAIVQSAAVGGDRSRLGAARTRVRIADETFRREQGLYQQRISAQKDMLEAQNELEQARADLAAIESSLALVGGGSAAGTYTVTAPIAGVVTRRDVTAGNSVGIEDPLFQVVDTSAVWAELDVPDGELAAVRPGQTVTLTVDGLGERTFTGPITFIAPEIDPTTRTAHARVPLANPDGALRANMFASARIAVSAAATRVTVPRAAVQHARGAALVFVRIADDQYETRRVTIGSSEGDRVEITKGLRAGETVVTAGSFLLKTETLKDSIGAGCCEAD